MTKTLTATELYEAIRDNIDYISMDDFSELYCDRSRSYLRTIKARKLELPSEVLADIANTLIEKRALTQLAQRKAVIDKLLENIAEQIARRTRLLEHKRLRKMLERIVDDINAKKAIASSYSAMPIVIA
jgi:hypothetical protein